MTDMNVLNRLDVIERRVGLGKYSPARELNRRQIRQAHGKRVMAREVQNGYGAYGWREREPVCRCEDPNTCQSCPDR